jgi:hypothetical protein
MFLSLGSGQFSEALSGYTGFGGGQPGAATGIRSYKTTEGRTETGQYIGWGAYKIDNPSACGTRITASGIEMNRGWKIPSGGENNDSIGEPNGLNIDSFMVSPNSGVPGSGNLAFSLVNQRVYIPSGFNATVYYRLAINFEDYARPYKIFSGKNVGENGYFDTGNASNPGGSETVLLNGWKNLSGIYRQVWPGLQFVDNSGGCATTIRGSQLEPSLSNSSQLYCYFSPDISQFATSKYGTGFYPAASSESGAYNSYGLSANYTEYVDYLGDTTSQDLHYLIEHYETVTDRDIYYYSGDSTPNSSFYLTKDEGVVLLNDAPYNIHLNKIPSTSGYKTLLPSFKYNSKTTVNATNETVNMATPGADRYSSTFPNYGQAAIFSSALRRLPISKNVGARNQGITRSARIAPIQTLGWNARYGSMVLAFFAGGLTNLNSVTAYPYLEYLFFDNSGRAANSPHYRVIPEIYLEDRGSGVANVQFYITGNGISSGPNSPVQRIWGVTGFMGGYYAGSSGINPTYDWTGYISGTEDSPGDGTHLPSGILWSGSNVPSTTSGYNKISGSTLPYGYGAVYGMVTSDSGFYYKPYDVCLLDNPVWSGFSGQSGMGAAPISTGETGLLCWPNPSSKINLIISGMKYFSPYWSVTLTDTNDFIGSSGAQYVGYITGSAGQILSGNGNHSFAGGTVVISAGKITSSFTGTSSYIFTNVTNGSGCVPTQWKKPVGRIHHLEFYSGSGYRILPNYGNANINFTTKEGNVYDPTRGGSYPGFSMENGMELYFDFKWSG